MSANTVVVVLNASGNQELYCGWRVEEIFRGELDEPAAEIAHAASEQLGMALQVHAELFDDDARTIVLRWSTAYSWTLPRSAPSSAQRVGLRLVPSPSYVRSFPPQEHPSGVRRRANVGHQSGTFLCDEVERMTAQKRARTA